MIFLGESSLRHTLKQYLEHYHSERNHQGIGNQLIETQTEVQQELNLEESIPIERHQRLGGMLNYYQRAA
jgi:hypothetical protein